MSTRRTEAFLAAALCAVGGLAPAAPPAGVTTDAAVLQASHLRPARSVASGWSFDHTSRVRGGLTYYDDAFDSQVGGSYSLDMAVPLVENFSGFLSASHNHSERGSQYLGTLGWFRQGSAYGSALSGLSGGVLFDQFTDTRFDGLYVSQLRLFAGYAISDWLAAGVTYYDPLEGDDTVGLGLPGLPATASFRTAETVEAYLSGWWGCDLITARAGYRDDLDVVVAGLLHQRRLSSRLGTYASVNYQDGSTWAASAGLEFWFGSGGCRRGRQVVSHVTGEHAVVRGQSPAGPGNPFTDPTLGANLHYDAQTFGSQMVASNGGVDLLTQPDEVDTESQNDPVNNSLDPKCVYFLPDMYRTEGAAAPNAVRLDVAHPCNQVLVK